MTRLLSYGEIVSLGFFVAELVVLLTALCFVSFSPGYVPAPEHLRGALILAIGNVASLIGLYGSGALASRQEVRERRYRRLVRKQTLTGGECPGTVGTKSSPCCPKGPPCPMFFPLPTRTTRPRLRRWFRPSRPPRC